MNSTPEVWGGVECTVNRVNDTFYDQMEMSGHAGLFSDVELLVGLGFKALRFPLLWERMAPDDIAEITWAPTDECLSILRANNIRVIAGLVHHGNGPRYTHLLDPSFPEKLAQFASRVAERYPWIDAYTPVNEPLTTARFSGLYGHWYPHKSDTLSFLRIVLLECLAIAKAMRAIRQINPAAKLVQTEDLGKIFSTPALSYQAELENMRRWLSMDILMGRFGPTHPLWEYGRKYGMPEALADECAMAPCPPDIIGINHYITSNRFLDEHLDRYPWHSHGGNGKHRYADVEAAWMGGETICGPRELCLETWRRYHLPIAITEAHMGSTRDEQMRWLSQVWQSSCQLLAMGVDIRAVTVWSLLGSYDWDSLVTLRRGHYEPGAFDVRASQIRPTALAAMTRELANHQTFDHPVLDMPGWWQRADRLKGSPITNHGMVSSSDTWPMDTGNSSQKKARQIIITGGESSLGSAFAYVCTRRGLPYKLLSNKDLDLANEQKVKEMFIQISPWALIHAADYTGWDEVENLTVEDFRDNLTGTEILVRECARRNIPLVSFSSEQVFDGHKRMPYTEKDQPAPLNLYGKSKLAAEMAVLAHQKRALVIRTSRLFGPWDLANFLAAGIQRLLNGQMLYAAHDLWMSPTYLPDLVDASLDLLIDGECGIWHLVNVGETNPAEFAKMAAMRLGLDLKFIVSVPSSEMRFAVNRPAFTVLASERGQMMPALEHAVERYIEKYRLFIH